MKKILSPKWVGARFRGKGDVLHKVVLSAAAIVLLGGFLFAGHAFAAVSVTAAPSGGNISVDKAANGSSPAYTSIGNIVITEGAQTDFADTAGAFETLILTAPSGWEFQAATGSVVAANPGNVSNESISVSTSAITLTFKVKNNTTRTDTVTVSGIKVRSTDGTSLPQSGNILRTSGNPGTATIAGITNDSTNFGALSQAAGGVAKASIVANSTTVEAPGIAILTITLRDTFNHLVPDGTSATLNSTFGTPSGSGTSVSGVISRNVSASAVGTASLTIGTSTMSGDTSISFVDTTAPVIAGHADINSEATSPSGAAVSYTAPNSTDAVDGTLAASCLPASGSTFALGTTTVTCTKTDAHSNVATPTTFSIHVGDTTAPVITLLGSGTVPLTVGDSYTDAGATASDIVDGTITGSIVTTVTPGPVDTSAPNTFTVHYNVSDAAGNAALEVTRTVTVSPAPPATHTITVSTGANGSISPAGPGVSVPDAGSQGFTITADPGYHIASVLVDSLPVGTSTIYTFNNVTADHTISASFAVDPIDQTISFGPLADKVYGDADFSVNATSTSGLPVSFSTLSSACSVTGGNVIHLISNGSCTITASQAGDATYNPAPDVQQTFAIAQKTLTITGILVTSKVFDGTTVATIDASAASLGGGVVGGDTVFVSTSTATGSFTDANAGTSKTVTLSGLLGGADAGKYIATASATGDITAEPITVTAAADSKTYDGTTSASATPTVTSGTLYGTDSGSFSEVYADKNAGTGKTLTPSGTVSDGNGGNNYAITFTPSTNGTITAKDLTVSATGQNKIYDGTTAATVTLTTDALGGDTVTATSTSGTFADKNVGTGKTVSVSGISISGADAGNYNLLSTTANTTADITVRSLSITADNASKVYGDADPALTYTPNPGDLVGGDSITGSLTRAAGESVNTYAISENVALSAGSNYTATFTPGTFTITAKTINVAADAGTKVFGTSDPALTYTNDPLSFSDSFTGALTRDPGEAVGTYNITQGTLALSSNYNLVFTGALFTITNTPPTANADSLVVDEDNALPINLSGTDTDGTVVEYEVLSGPANGVFTYSTTTGAGTYTPNLNYNGSDTITFRVRDNAGAWSAASADVSITINPVNDDPVLGAIGSQVVDELTTLSFTATSTDVDGGTPVYSLSGAPAGASIDSSTGQFTWTPTEAQGPGIYGFDVIVSDGAGGSDSETVTTTVNEVNISPVADDQFATTTTNNALLITLGGHDDDLPPNTLTYQIYVAPAHGVLGEVIGNQVTYTPNPGFGGRDSFQFRINDNTSANPDALSNVATVSMVVIDPPHTDLPPGDYVGSQFIHLTAAGATSIRYTDDGTTPNCSTSNPYTTIELKVNLNLKVISCYDGVPAVQSDVQNFVYGYVNGPVATGTGGSSTGVGSTGGPATGGGQVLGVSTGPTENGTGSASTGGGKVLGASIFQFTKNLRYGMRDSDVTELQKVLKKLGLFNAEPTGYFGPLTLAAVKAYQRSHGILPVSGFFGPLTRASLNALLPTL